MQNNKSITIIIINIFWNNNHYNYYNNTHINKKKQFHFYSYIFSFFLIPLLRPASNGLSLQYKYVPNGQSSKHEFKQQTVSKTVI